MKPRMEEFRKARNVDMMFFMLTDIVKETSTLLYAGVQADTVVEAAFHKSGCEGSIYLSGVVSRKKQLIPSLVQGLHQL